MDQNKVIGAGLILRKSFDGHPQGVVSIAWSPNGDMLACGSGNGSIALWDVKKGSIVKPLLWYPGPIWTVAWSPSGDKLAAGSNKSTIKIWKMEDIQQASQVNGHASAVLSLAWSPDGSTLVSGSDDKTIGFTKENNFVRAQGRHTGKVTSLAWSPNGEILASGSEDQTIRFVNLNSGTFESMLKGHTGTISCMAWAPDSTMLASGSKDKTIGIWNAKQGRLINQLEGHYGDVQGIAWSFDGRIIISNSLDGTLRFWNASTGELLQTVQVNPGSLIFSSSSIAVYPNAPLIAIVFENGKTVSVIEYDTEILLQQQSSLEPTTYTNAKIVLVGDSGVGKSGLGLVLSKQIFEPTESTHGRRVWMFEKQEAQVEGRSDVREALLWDLAGQPGYRIVHQLHLNEVSVALVVFDAQSEKDTFAGVKHWERAIRQAQRTEGNANFPCKKFLVAARVDRGGISISSERVKKMLDEMDFDGFFQTSAKENWGTSDLSEAIMKNIDWEQLPRITSNHLFQKIKQFFIREKEAGRVLTTSDDLFRAFLQYYVPTSADENIRQQFDACIGRIESRDLIRRLSFGNLVLLQPELLDSYASALVISAKDEPDGLGSILEDNARTGRFRMSEDERVKDVQQQSLLLIATVEDLLSHEIALREQASDGSYLVFPSQFTRENPDLPDPEGKEIIFSFEGPVLNIYATLAVRLSHSGFFEKADMWKDAATYSAKIGGRCGMFLRQLEDGKGEITLFFDKNTSQETKFQFEYFVHSHLLKRAIQEKIIKRHIVICPECDCLITDRQANERLRRGFSAINCPICQTELPLIQKQEKQEANTEDVVLQMDIAADAQREKEKAIAMLKGKVATSDFDVFLAHNSKNKVEVEKVSDRLKTRGLNPWLDKEQIPPGRWFQDVIQNVIPSVKSVAVFIGEDGIGKWQAVELRAFLSECLERDLPVIPILLPGVTTLPKNLLFLQELNYVKFDTLNDDEALGRLIWGITGERPI